MQQLQILIEDLRIALIWDIGGPENIAQNQRVSMWSGSPHDLVLCLE